MTFRIGEWYQHSSIRFFMIPLSISCLLRFKVNTVYLKNLYDVVVLCISEFLAAGKNL